MAKIFYRKLRVISQCFNLSSKQQKSSKWSLKSKHMFLSRATGSGCFINRTKLANFLLTTNSKQCYWIEKAKQYLYDTYFISKKRIWGLFQPCSLDQDWLLGSWGLKRIWSSDKEHVIYSSVDLLCDFWQLYFMCLILTFWKWG